MRHSIKTLLLILTLTTGCRKFVTISPPKNELVTSALFSDSLAATSAVLGIYINMMNTTPTMLNGGLSLFTGLSSDELTYTSTNSGYLEFYENAISTSNSNNNGLLWTDAYSSIYQANACIEGLTESSGLSTSLKNELLGESKFVRAFLYFNLVNLYGPVPLVVSTNYQVNATLPRTSIDSVNQQIIADLTDCLTLFPLGTSNGNTRPNAYSASALLARVYLYQNQWANAETMSDQLITSNVYSLETNLNSVFLPSSTEAIWQMSPVSPGTETPEGTTYVPTTNKTIPVYVINSYLLNAFESGDDRRAMWLDSNVVTGHVYYYPYKYKLGRDNNTSPKEYCTILRLGEQYLIRAEAEANGAGSGISAAISDLNIIRNRAGLPAYAGATDKASVLAAIYHERQVELFLEWGHRWYDLKRTGNVDAVMGTGGVCAAKGGSWSDYWQLYPIPLSQIQANTFLIQNNGYN